MNCSRQGCTNQPSRRGWCNSHYETWRSRQHLYGRFESTLVDAAPVRAHVNALQAAGLSERNIVALAGVSRGQLATLIRGRTDKGRPPSKRVSRSAHDRLMAVPVPHAAFVAARGSSRVDSTGTVRRLQALVAAGWPQEDLAERLGMAASNFGNLVRGARDQCTASRAKDVAALFAELQLLSGPSDRARQRAQKRGWALPLEWDEDTIDDPDAEPVRAAWTPASAREERREQVAELTTRGHSAEEIADLLGVDARTIQRDRAVAS